MTASDLQSLCRRLQWQAQTLDLVRAHLDPAARVEGVGLMVRGVYRTEPDARDAVNQVIRAQARRAAGAA